MSEIEEAVYAVKAAKEKALIDIEESIKGLRDRLMDGFESILHEATVLEELAGLLRAKAYLSQED